MASRWRSTIASTLVVAALAWGALAAGAAPMSKAAYETRMQAIARQVAAAQAKDANRPHQSGAALDEEQAGILSREAAELAAIHPPQQVAKDHSVFVAYARATAASYHALARFLAHKGPRPNSKASVVWSERMSAAISDLQAKHYDLGGFTGN